MSFLIDTDICSAYLKGNRIVWNRFMQFTGGLHISAITLAELNVWAQRAGAPKSRLESLQALLNDLIFLEVDVDVAQRYGHLQALLLDQGKPAPGMDLVIAATALVHNLTLVTHNTQDFINTPGLRIADWLVP